MAYVKSIISNTVYNTVYNYYRIGTIRKDPSESDEILGLGTDITFFWERFFYKLKLNHVDSGDQKFGPIPWEFDFEIFPQF